jgi:uncharacterized protein YdeI (YjbR/CyaY-like superfamily)
MSEPLGSVEAMTGTPDTTGTPGATGAPGTEATKDGLPSLPFESAQAWERWLAEHYETAPGIWIKIARKGSGIPSVTMPEAIEVALCHGWIDSQRVQSGEEEYYLQRFTPRTARSKWSKVNCAKVEELVAAGRMGPGGLREIERAKADGRWEAAYDPPSEATVPDDLRAAFDANPVAAEFFATLDSRNRYAVLHRIQDARRPETRARRIEKYVTMLASREKIYP